MSFCVLTKEQRTTWSLKFVLVAAMCPMVLGCSSDAVKDEQTLVSPKSVEEIKTAKEAAAFLQPALRTVQRDSRALRESPTARAAQQQADELLHLAIQWLDGKKAIEPTQVSTEDNQANEKTLLGLWRHRLNVDGKENLMIMGPEKTFVVVHGSQVWVGNWERRDGFLYTQNIRDSADDFRYLGLPNIERIADKDDGTFEFNSVTHEAHPGITLTQIQ